VACSSTLKIEAVRCLETSVNFYQTALRHAPEDGTVNSPQPGNYKSSAMSKVICRSRRRRKDLGWIQLAQDRAQWWDIVSTVMNLYVP
jgi:hypothetical protein